MKLVEGGSRAAGEGAGEVAWGIADLIQAVSGGGSVALMTIYLASNGEASRS